MTELPYRRQAADTLMELVRGVVTHVQARWPGYLVALEDRPPLFDGRYYYINVLTEAMRETGVRRRQVRVAREAVPQPHRMFFVSSAHDERGSAGDHRPSEMTPPDALQQRLYGTLTRFITDCHNVGYVGVNQDEPNTYQTCLTPREALEAATRHPSGVKRASGKRVTDGRRYEPSLRDSGEEYVGAVGGVRSISVDAAEELLGVDWEPEQFSGMDRDS